jgi:RNA polymerase sigma-70 factor (ECF subfamily)
VHDDAVDQSALVARVRDGNELAFQELYRKVHPGLLRYLRVLVGDQDADDVASETWLQLIRDLGSFRGDDQAFRAWAATVGRHRAMDHLRRQRRRPAVQAPSEVLDELPGTADTSELAATAISTDAALALIATLPGEQAEAVLLRVVMGLDARGAGRVLGKRPGAVRVAAHRGLRRLAERLNGADTRRDGTGRGTPDGTGRVAREGEGVTDPAAPALKGMR